MLLHKDKEKFEQLIIAVSENSGIDKALVEKDYYITIFLKELVGKEPLLVFKGGTCLSKCFGLIKRFSEDIDINLENIKDLTQSRKKQLKKNIETVTKILELSLENPDEIMSGMDYNLYRVSYPIVFTNRELKQHLEVESVFRIAAFPTELRKCSSLIYEYLVNNNLNNIITEYQLEPFIVNVQSLERTFIDKIFAIGDYFLNGRVEFQSRHLYDLFKIAPLMKLDDKLKKLFDDVRKERQGKQGCLSAERGVDFRELLKKIVSEKTYKTDYNTKTSVLLYEKITYDEVITNISDIIIWLEHNTEI